MFKLTVAKSGILLIFILANFIANAQSSGSRLSDFLEDRNLPVKAFKFPKAVTAFYELTGFQFAWLQQEHRKKALLDAFKQAADLGLKTDDYVTPAILALLTGREMLTTADSLQAETGLTDAAMHFLHDIKFGTAIPQLSYNGIHDSHDNAELPGLLVSMLQDDTVPIPLQAAEPKIQGYASIKKWIMHLNAVLTQDGFKEIAVQSKTAKQGNAALIRKLYQLGILDSLSQSISDSLLLHEKIKSAQELFDCPADGVLTDAFLEALNVPLSERLASLQRALNAIRWLSSIQQQQKMIVINIPSATLLVFERDSVILESRVIVGKKATPTPTLASKVFEVILYPYWMVPRSIAIKELLPAVRKNAGLLETGNYQLLDQKGKVINPLGVNWDKISASNFPYTIRQSTGCDNSLGLIKLNFYNPYSVYLHDTPGKELFAVHDRFYSHGCIRVEKAMDLGRLALNNSLAIDTISEKGCLQHQSPVVLPTVTDIAVVVLYNIAWIDGDGQLRFYKNIYSRIKP